MTDRFDADLRRRLERLTAVVPVDMPGTVAPVPASGVHQGRATRPFAFGSGASLVALVVIGIAIAGLGGVQLLGPGARSTDTAVAPSGPVSGSATNGPFRLVIRSSESHYAPDEPIIVEAALEYDGTESSVRVSHALGAHGSAVNFGIIEPIIGDLTLGGVWQEACTGTTLERGKSVVVPFAKSGAWDGNDPFAGRMTEFMQEQTLHLGEGTWHIWAGAQFSLGGCGGDRIDLRAEIEVIVGSGTRTGIPTAAPDWMDPVYGGYDTGMFTLQLSAPQSRFEIGQPIAISAEYAWGGAEPSVISHFEPEVEFSIRQQGVDGTNLRSIGTYGACAEVRLENSQARPVPLSPANVMVVGVGPLPEDFDAKLDRGVLELPVGRWRITAVVRPIVGSCSSAGEVEAEELYASIEIDVEPVASKEAP